jgi:anti-anti-sigma factor
MFADAFSSEGVDLPIDGRPSSGYTLLEDGMTRGLSAASWMMTIGVELADDGGATIVVAGELDGTSVDGLSDELDRVLSSGRSPIVVDLGAVSFVDVGAYRALAEFGQACRAAGVVNHWRSGRAPVRLLVRVLGPLPGIPLDGPLVATSVA